MVDVVRGQKEERGREKEHLLTSICCFFFISIKQSNRLISPARMGADAQVHSIIDDNLSFSDHHTNDEVNNNTLVFTYGTLKRGFSNHVLLQDLIVSGDASFIGICRTAKKLPLVCGPYRVPFLLNIEDSGEHVSGELYSVSPRGLSLMDDLEGICRGHYQRLPISLILLPQHRLLQAHAYFAHSSYADSLWKKNKQIGYPCYSQNETKGYIRRKDRPQHLSFIDQIRIFVSSPDPWSFLST